MKNRYRVFLRFISASLLFLHLQSAVAATYTVNIVADGGSGTGFSGDFRYCLNQANSAAGADTIVFDAGLFATPQTILLFTALPAITGDLTIFGPQNAVTLQRSSGGFFSIFVINTGVTASFSSLSITNGSVASSGGGGILNNGTLSLQNCTIRGNSVIAGSTGGGGIFNGGTLYMTNCTVSGNTSATSPFGSGGIQNSSNMAMVNCIVSGNQASSGVGGGISTGGGLYMSHCTITGNSAFNNGGGIQNNNSVFMRGCIVALNTAPTNPDINGSTFTSDDYNLIQNTTGATIAGTTTNNITGQDPLFVTNVPTAPSTSGNLQLQASSPAIAKVPLSQSPTFDRLGLLRKSSVFDMGALETGATSVTPVGLGNVFIVANNTAAFTLGNSGVRVQFTTAGNPTLTLAAAQFSSIPNVGVLPGGVVRLSTDRYWNISTVNAGIATQTYNLTLDITGITGVANRSTLRLLRRPNGTSTWTDAGAPSVVSGNLLTWNGLNGFSDFAIGAGADNPLPVELSSFSAQQARNGIALSWTTASEKNNAGFEVQRIENGELKMENWKVLGFIKGNGTTSQSQSYSFVDKSASGKVQYRLKQIDFDGQFEILPTVEVDAGVPKTFALEQNYPNPFNPSTTISYQLPVASQVSLKVYDMLGREVATLVNARQESGRYSVQLSTVNYQLSSGVYFYRLQAGAFVETKKMLLVR